MVMKKIYFLLFVLLFNYALLCEQVQLIIFSRNRPMQLYALLESIETVIKRLKSVSRKEIINLTPKQSELLEWVEKYGTLGSTQICQEMNINRSRVNQLIAPLIKAGIITKQGTTRAVKYSLASIHQ